MKKTVLLFPGQGTQKIGMGKAFIEKYASARRVYDEAEDVLHMDIKKLCLEGDEAKLKETQNAQLAILTTSVAMYKVYQKEIGLKPLCSAGHSLGEYSALTCAEAFTFEDALKLVKCRGELMKAAPAGRMLSVKGTKPDELQEILYKYKQSNDVAVISCHNSLVQNVISVSERCADSVIKELEAIGSNCVALNVASGFHSMLMQEAANELKKEIDKIELSMPKWDIISNVTAMPYANADEIKIRLVQHMTYPVRWKETMDYIYQNGIDCGVEIGMGNVLKVLAKNNIGKLHVYSLDSVESIASIGKEIGNLNNIRKEAIRKCVKHAVTLPNFNTVSSTYYNDVILPCKKLKELYISSDNNATIYTHDDITEALKLLKKIAKNKKVHHQEINYVVSDVLSVFESNQIEECNFSKEEMVNEKAI